MRCTAYDEYKPSGIEWLGNVPSHWTIARSDGIVSSERRQVQPEVFLSEDVFHYSIPLVQELGTGAVEEGESIKSAKQPVFRKSLLVSKLNPRKATIVVAEPQPDLRTLCSTEFVTLFADKCDLGFLTYVTLSEAFRQRLDAAVQSVTRSHQRANPRDIYSFWNAWPPLDEQQTIARFLDAKTAQIDELIAKKRQLIDKLKEKRQALIARTVTCGLPPEAAKAAGLEPNSEMKNANQLWLGEVPPHWDVKPLKFVTKIKTGFAFNSDDFTDEGVPVVRIGDISRNGHVDLSDAKYLPVEYQRSHAAVKIKNNDILMAMTGATIGKAARYTASSPALLNQRVCAFRALPTFHQGYLWFILNSDFYIRYVLLIAFGGAQPNISDKQLLDCCVPVPPPKEQVKISIFLEVETGKLDDLMTQANSAIDRLTEYRQALITAAVTGKIDVREAA